MSGIVPLGCQASSKEQTFVEWRVDQGDQIIFVGCYVPSILKRETTVEAASSRGVLNGRSEGPLICAGCDVFADRSRFSENLGVVWN